jgi:hypothetical protein
VDITEIWMLQCLVKSNSLIRVNLKHLIQQIIPITAYGLALDCLLWKLRESVLHIFNEYLEVG